MSTKNNKHLEPVFKILLPALEKAGIDYWVYGGVSVAAYAGKFLRPNGDVDIFVRDNDFDRARSILQELSNQNNFGLKLGEKNGRLKLIIKISGKERLSMIPVYQKSNIVLFIYMDGDQEYPERLLEKVERNISDYRFFISHNDFVKEMFINHIKVRPDKKKRKKYQIDAKAILNPEELAELNWVLQ